MSTKKAKSPAADIDARTEKALGLLLDADDQLQKLAADAAKLHNDWRKTVDAKLEERRTAMVARIDAVGALRGKIRKKLDNLTRLAAGRKPQHQVAETLAELLRDAQRTIEGWNVADELPDSDELLEEIVEAQVAADRYAARLPDPAEAEGLDEAESPRAAQAPVG